MNFTEYREIIKNTFREEYPIYLLELLIKKIEMQGLVYNNKRKKNDKGSIDISAFLNTKIKITALFNELNEIVKKCEEFEYERAYRYSHIYHIKNYNEEIIHNLIKQNKISQFTDYTESDDNISSFITTPTCRIIKDSEILLKFNLLMKSKLEEGKPIKHVVLAIINTDLNTLEIRQDVIPMTYKTSDKFYITNVRSVKAWISDFLKLSIININFQAITKHMKSKNSEDVAITAVKFRRNGMMAELDSASNEDLTLPILDELRQKIDSNELFNIDDNTKKIKKMLEEFIEEIEENSDLPAAKIFWKTKGYKLNAYHDQTESGDSFFKWIGELKDKEGMDYVTRYLIDCEKEIREYFDS